MAKLKIPCVFVLRVHACSSWKHHLENTAWFASWPEFLKRIPSRGREHVDTHSRRGSAVVFKMDFDQIDVFLSQFIPWLEPNCFFTIFYPNVMLIKSLCGNLDMCVNFYAFTYSQLRILFADRDRKQNKSCFSVTLGHSFSFRAKSISVPDRAIECGWYI